MVAREGGAKRQKSSIELMLSRRAMEVWLIVVGEVGFGGFVGPWVPVAMTPGGKEEDAARTEVTAEAPSSRLENNMMRGGGKTTGHQVALKAVTWHLSLYRFRIDSYRQEIRPPEISRPSL